MSSLTLNDLEFYKKYQEWYNYILYRDKHNIRYSHKLKVFDVVRISDRITQDKGYSGQVGIVCGLSVSNMVNVIAYDKINSRYWVCSFNEEDLVKQKNDMWEFKELYHEMKMWLWKNNFKLSTELFKKSWSEYKEGKSFEEALGYEAPINKKNKIIKVDFKKKERT